MTRLQNQAVGWNRCTCALADGVVCEECDLQIEGHHWHLVPPRRLRLYEDYPTGIPYHATCGSAIIADSERRKPEIALSREVTDEDHLEALLDLAREGAEAAFMDLARCLGVKKGKLDAMWAGARRRVPVLAVGRLLAERMT